jgi:hypothetical protein
VGPVGRLLEPGLNNNDGGYLQRQVPTVVIRAEAGDVLLLRLARAEAYWLQGEPRLAGQEAALADDVAAGSDGWERGEIAVWLRRMPPGSG